jgi:protease YdgD
VPPGAAGALRRWVALAFLLWWGWLPAAELDLPGVSGPDDRAVVDSSAWPWSAIGRLNSTLGGHCTGTVVGPRKVLTAAHCLWNRRTGAWLPACAIHFLAGYRRGEYLVHSLVDSFRVAQGYAAGAQGRPTDPDRDWAVVYLAEDTTPVTGRLEVQDFGPEEAARLQGAGAILLRAGYSRDHRHVLTRHVGCRVTGWLAGARLALHDCDATFGDSGSPLLVRRDSDHLLVGLHVAARGGAGKWAGVAVPASVFRAVVTEPAPPVPAGRRFEACSLGPAADG